MEKQKFPNFWKSQLCYTFLTDLTIVRGRDATLGSMLHIEVYLIVSLEQWFLAKIKFCPQGMFGGYLETFLGHGWRGAAPGI